MTEQDLELEDETGYLRYLQQLIDLIGEEDEDDV